MQVSLIVSVIGPDRPGLVEQLSSAVTQAGGNWEGSRLVRLGGQFAGMVQVILPENQLQALESQLVSLESAGLNVTSVHSGEQTTDAANGTAVNLEVVGQDRSGIVSTISKVLADQGVNVIELATACKDAPMSGERDFHTTAKLGLPGNIDLADLRYSIEEIATDLIVELDLNIER